MKIHIETETQIPSMEPIVGNVYPRMGGRSRQAGEMMIIFAISDPAKQKERFQYRGRMACVMVIDPDGNIVGADSYGMSYFDGKCPIAFVEGLEDIDLTMRTI
ncbi:MAG: hypothetical protein QM647_15170 [Asticcacaulis sp.]|uniref:hypothetical protein n=1 Tax=Asticcacaulis sp. TaxID=1872648 RepID=UPI0039E372E6